MKSSGYAIVLGLATAFFVTAVQAAILPLEGRLAATAGGTDYQAYYDPNLNITWAAIASSGGSSDWITQQAWAASLNIGGITGWRLPVADVNGDGTVVNCSPGGVAGCADNEMGYLFWNEGIRVAAPGPFSGMTSLFYWSGTESGSNAWRFRFADGLQGLATKTGTIDAWAVYSGDVSTIPVPAAIWLFGTGLLGLLGIAKPRQLCPKVGRGQWIKGSEHLNPPDHGLPLCRRR
jgi:hypothetical protein